MLMNVSLTPELEKFIAKQVRSGLYQTSSEVVREGLRMLRQRAVTHQERLESLRAEIQKGVDAVDRGDVVPFTPELLEAIKSKGRAKLAQKGGKVTR
jgi:antitoxin ParD1/3/4